MKTIVVVCQDIVLINFISKTLKGLYETVIFSNIQSALDYIYNSIPNLLIIDFNANDSISINILHNFKEDPIFNQLPVLAVLPDQMLLSAWDFLSVEDYIWKADIERDILARVNLSILRSERIVEINPLTRLPGNISINRQIQNRLDRNEEFAFAYADLDYFKPFNDKYGFSRGDEVIKITGRLILNTVKNKQPRNSFTGHIGGDDFIYLMDSNLVDEASQEIIDAFDRIIPTFYDPPDKEKGCIESFDRWGNKRIFDIMNISIGITNTNSGVFSHYGEITESGSEMKKHAKQFKGSCYKSDRRHDIKE
ncbi:MAG: diguanylate cyclase [Thermodesulfobacteriota bacterium]|nr:diguanylate cyclase [Thermodesulfobacteriota bacterium]